MIYQLPVSAKPNQFFSTTINGVTWNVTLETRLDNLYITLENKTDGLVLANRICLNNTYLGYGFLFTDIDGNNDPTYEKLGVRYFLLWTDELNS